MKKKNIQTPVLSMAIAACMISHQQNAQAGENPSLQNDSVPYVTMPDVSPKLTTGDGNPLEIMDLTTATIIHIYTNSAGNGMYSITQ